MKRVSNFKVKYSLGWLLQYLLNKTSLGVFERKTRNGNIMFIDRDNIIAKGQIIFMSIYTYDGYERQNLTLTFQFY